MRTIGLKIPEKPKKPAKPDEQQGGKKEAG